MCMYCIWRSRGIREANLKKKREGNDYGRLVVKSHGKYHLKNKKYNSSIHTGGEGDSYISVLILID